MLTSVNVKCIHSIYQSTDGKIFQGAEEAKELALRHEINLVCGPIKQRIDQIGYAEYDVAKQVNERFPRRWHSVLITATPHNVASYHDVLMYVSMMHHEPPELIEAAKMEVEFPAQLYILVYKGTKRYHAHLLAQAMANCLKSEIKPVELAPIKPAPEAPARGSKRYPYKGEMHTIREIATMSGISETTIKKRISSGWPYEKAFSQPVAKRAVKKYLCGKVMKTPQEIAKWTGLSIQTVYKRLREGFMFEPVPGQPERYNMRSAISSAI